MNRITWAIIGIVMLAASCGESGSTNAASESPAGSVGDSSSEPLDPLVGTWRQDFSCVDNVNTFHRLVLVDYDEAFYRKWVRDFAWGPNSQTATALTAEALCEGASDHYRIMRVEDGVVTLFDGPQAAPSNPAAYELLNDHAFTLNDGGLDITDCDSSGNCTTATYKYTFSIVGDRLTIELHHDPRDPWGGTPFEVAPFYRVS